jgi:exopolysaccharide production protein ExoQ
VTLLIVAYFSVGSGARSRVVDTALMGRSQQAGSLTGRLPLWEELLDHAADRPILGYGYEGFWTEKRIAAIMRSQGWSLQNAHNSYFEILLQLGCVGLFFAIWFLLAGTSSLAAATTLTRDPGYAFACGVVMFGMINSGLESLFVKLRFSPTIAMIGLLMVALYYPLSGSNESESRGPQRRVSSH